MLGLRGFLVVALTAGAPACVLDATVGPDARVYDVGDASNPPWFRDADPQPCPGSGGGSGPGGGGGSGGSGGGSGGSGGGSGGSGGGSGSSGGGSGGSGSGGSGGGQCGCVPGGSGGGSGGSGGGSGGSGGGSGGSGGTIGCPDAGVSATVDAAPACTSVAFTNTGSAVSVWVTGSFSGWGPDPAQGAIQLSNDGEDNWSAMTTIAPGSYFYKLIIDGDQWQPDPANPATETDAEGNTNSVLSVCGG